VTGFALARETVPAVGEPLADDALVDLDTERRTAGVDEILTSLDDELVGLAGIKTRIAELASLLLVDRVRGRFGLSAEPPSLHMCFTGNPGTGKTTVALRMAELLNRLGYLRTGRLVTVTRDDLVGQYVGHTAPKTKDVLNRALGGVLFIDEAYYLYRAENERDYGSESIEILLQYMENHRDDLVVILAGYGDRMDTFFTSNPGMSSRIAHHLEFPDYTLDELTAIGALMLERQRYRLSPAAEATFRDHLAERIAQPRFANARTVRNVLDQARLRHANRLVASSDIVDKGALMQLEPPDVT
jgi:probable Rubsico expression protein CbbX